MSFGVEQCSFAAGTEVGEASGAECFECCELRLYVQFYFNTIGLFIIRAAIFSHLRSRALPNSLFASIRLSVS